MTFLMYGLEGHDLWTQEVDQLHKEVVNPGREQLSRNEPC